MTNKPDPSDAVYVTIKVGRTGKSTTNTVYTGTPLTVIRAVGKALNVTEWATAKEDPTAQARTPALA